MLNWPAFISDWESHARELLSQLPEGELFPIELEVMRYGLCLGVDEQIAKDLDELVGTLTLNDGAADYVDFLMASGGLRLLGMDAEDGFLLPPSGVRPLTNAHPNAVDAWADDEIGEDQYYWVFVKSCGYFRPFSQLR